MLLLLAFKEFVLSVTTVQVVQLSPLSVPLVFSQGALELELHRIVYLVNKDSIVQALLPAYNVLQVLTAQSSQLTRRLLQT